MGVVLRADRTHQDHTRALPEADSLRRLQREMLGLASSAGSQTDLLGRFADLLNGYAEPLAMFYFRRDEQGELNQAFRVRPNAADDETPQLMQRLLTAAQAACRSGEIDVQDHSLSDQSLSSQITFAAPVALRGCDPEAIAVVFSTDQAASYLVMLVQMLSGHMVLWHVLQESRRVEADSRDAAALIELLDSISAAGEVQHACHTLAGELKDYLACSRVAVGVRRAGRGRCRLLAMSGVARFDKRSLTVHAIESAMDESILRQDVTRWPGCPGQQRHAALAHKKLAAQENVKSLISFPLFDSEETPVGVILVFDEDNSASGAAERFLRGSQLSLGAALAAVERMEGGRLRRLCRTTAAVWRSWRGKLVMGAMLLTLVGMLIPMPAKVHCDCRLEPVTRRFACAPFEGTLEKAFVKPGDIVRKGQLLAQMDGRELRWKRATLVADRNQAIKERDSAQAAHNFASQQIAQLEIERLELELRLLDHRAESLQVRSLVDGIVTSGDLERAAGAPIKIGQTLFEIAPLDAMIVELAVPDEEVSRIRPGQEIQVRLDAYPGKLCQAVVIRVQPRSEIRDAENVFIVEAELDNAQGQLRPGMKGRAKVNSGSRSLGWILFHKPWEYLSKRLSW